jgi:hypothetical protein
MQQDTQIIFTKAIQIIQIESGDKFLNNGEWTHNGKRVAVSTIHDSNFTINILEQHYFNGGHENLRYNISFGNETSLTASFSFNSSNYSNCSQAWKNCALKLELVLK